MAYIPILGNAGTIVIAAYIDDTLIFTNSINVFKFQEEYIESDGNKIIYDEDDNAIKHFIGFKKNIKFSVYNSSTENNYANMVQLLTNLDAIKLSGNSRITVIYRDGNIFATINDAIFVTLPQINNVSQSANTAEEFVFEIEERNPVTELLFGQITEGGSLIAENNSNLILESGGNGGKILLEMDKYL